MLLRVLPVHTSETTAFVFSCLYVYIPNLGIYNRLFVRLEFEQLESWRYCLCATSLVLHSRQRLQGTIIDCFRTRNANCSQYSTFSILRHLAFQGECLDLITTFTVTHSVLDLTVNDSKFMRSIRLIDRERLTSTEDPYRRAASTYQ
jgi:hypothetical protein